MAAEQDALQGAAPRFGGVGLLALVHRLHKLGLSAEDAAKQANWGPYKEWYIAEQQGPIAVRKIYEEIEGKLK